MLALLKQVSPETLQTVFAALNVRQIKRRATLLLSEDLSGQVAFVWSGRYRVTAVSPKGSGITLYAAIAGDVIGLPPALAGTETSDIVRLVCDRAGSLLFLDVGVLRQAARSDMALCEALIGGLAGLTVEYAARVYELAALDAKSRLRAELLRLARTAEHVDGRLVLKDAPTQAMLGAQIGAAREAITRHVRELTDAGLLVFGRGVIEFPDIEALRAKED